LALFGAEPVQARTVFDRNRVTGGGVTAGIDFALALVAQIAGDATAQTIQLALEYDPAPPLQSGTPSSAGPDIVAAYLDRADRLAPDRLDKIKAAALRLGL
jgi:cyclohexyl-isocyanide hydratase